MYKRIAEVTVNGITKNMEFDVSSNFDSSAEREIKEKIEKANRMSTKTIRFKKLLSESDSRRSSSNDDDDSGLDLAAGIIGGALIGGFLGGDSDSGGSDSGFDFGGGDSGGGGSDGDF